MAFPVPWVELAEGGVDPFAGGVQRDHDALGVSPEGIAVDHLAGDPVLPVRSDPDGLAAHRYVDGVIVGFGAVEHGSRRNGYWYFQAAQQIEK